MKLSALHISDLHRDNANPLRNPILLDSLKRDRDRYTSEQSSYIRPPDLIIVSGDVVQGVKNTVQDAESVLRRQYEEALEFLTSLAEEFVEGNKQRVIIVPGNHDVSAYHFLQSLELVNMDVGANTKHRLVEELFKLESPLRWSWSEFALYKIVNPEIYEQRFAMFVDFYSTFYDGQRSYSVEPGKQFDVFDFPHWGITIVGFCSCHNNDLLNRQGSIHPDCIASAGERLRANSNDGRLRFAVWHHNIEGSPLQVDYMDPDTVQNFIDGGFSLGFHGHQHKPQYLNTRFQYGSGRQITVISAGTLCGDPAYGFRRAYNLVELDTESLSGRLHVRVMQNDNLQMPIWGPGSVTPSSEGSLNFSFDAPPQPLVTSNHSASLFAEAADFYENQQYSQAVEVLLPLVQQDELARPLLLDCLIHLGDVARIALVFDPPRGTAEAIALMDSLWELGKRDSLQGVLNMPLVSESSDVALIELRTKYQARLQA